MEEDFPTCSGCGLPIDACDCADDPGGTDEEDGLKPEERIEAGIAYHVVEAEMIEALGKLQRAKNAVQ